MEFKSNKIKADILGLKKHLNIPDNYIIWDSKCEVEVKFNAELAIREWGIKALLAYATNVDGALFYECDHDESEKRMGEIEIKASLFESSDWKIESVIKPDVECELLQISQVIIDFENKSIYVS